MSFAGDLTKEKIGMRLIFWWEKWLLNLFQKKTNLPC
jgi:hypothetical protein